MNRRFYVSLLAFVLTLTATVAFVIGHSTGTTAASTNAALSALPASDFVISIDVQRALSESLPAILSSNPALLAKFNAHLEEFERKTGINPRVFDSIAIGGTLRPTVAASRRDPSNVLIARGHFKASELIDTAMASARKECQFEKEEQQYEGRTIFLISSVRSLKNSTGSDGSTSSRNKFAVTALDSNSIAAGSPESVRAAIDASMGRNRVDDELVRLALQSPNAVVGFSGKIPQRLTDQSSSHGSDNLFTKYVDGVRAFYGSFDVNGSDAESSVVVRFESMEQARDISEAINSVKLLASLGINHIAGSSPRHDALAAALKGLSITRDGTELRIDARIPQASLTPLIRMR